MTRLALLLGLFVGGLVATVVIVNSLYRREPEHETCWREWERVDAV